MGRENLELKARQLLRIYQVRKKSDVLSFYCSLNRLEKLYIKSNPKYSWIPKAARMQI